ncbi:tRNA pseudouridine synthase B [Tetrabaena socialis]|uniref:tRNA pseudouridine(55) synthase n=1 Tax=Tetrabaena socialis TaxID=47790 RepID=A0A2J8ACU1_9CHLO|nr:tRNA pseudouridine synthase B [Tetrabaena socialis]|eukprot:PNH10323.1 tRNA pseudouridine synthase B [Tetrabaena socialis]
MLMGLGERRLGLRRGAGAWRASGLAEAAAAPAPAVAEYQQECEDLTVASGDQQEREDRTAEASSSGARTGPDATPQEEAAFRQAAALRRSQRDRPTVIVPGASGRIEDLSLLHNGMFLVDKPLDWTSFDVCGKIRNMIRFLEVKKVGHAGTLDPNATGLLIVCTGKGTKFCDDFQAQDKEYSGTLRLGEATPSYDTESEVSERAPWEHITGPQLGPASSAARRPAAAPARSSWLQQLNKG